MKPRRAAGGAAALLVAVAALQLLSVALASSEQLKWAKLDMSRLTEKALGASPNVFPQASEHSPLLDVPIVDPPKRVAGYFKLDRTTKGAQMFYFSFQARTNPEKAPVVLWMTGGPGCSSELAVLYENGPYTLDRTGKALVETPYGWDVTHNMIFVDQPIGTGFSYTTEDGDDVYDEKGVADDMLDFLQHFFAAHPELADRPFFITGESYAGHYVPAVSHRVWLSNRNKEGPYINLKGLAVGNGLTEPGIQFNAYGDFAVQNKLIGSATRAWMSFLYPLCKLANEWCESTSWDLVCGLGLQYCMMTQFQPILGAQPDINVYDIRKKCEGRLCYDFSAADDFLNTAAVKKALGVPAALQWVSCSPDVYMDFVGDWLHRFDKVLPDMMSDGIRVMIYAGDQDLICNYLGNRRWVDALEWEGADGWDAASDEEWVVDGKPAGLVKQFGPLSFVQVYLAGHMVPMDQGLNSLAMITGWTRGQNLTLPKQKQDALQQQQQQQQGALAASSKVETLPELFARLTTPAPAPAPKTRSGCNKKKQSAATTARAASSASSASTEPAAPQGKRASRFVHGVLSAAQAKAHAAGQHAVSSARRLASAAARRMRAA